MFVPNDVVTTADVLLQVEIFLKTFKSSLLLLRSNQPNEWKEQLEVVKHTAARTADKQAVVEMLAFCSVEYECSLKEGTVSTLTKQLKAFSEANHINLGE